MHEDSALPYEEILPGGVRDGDPEYWFAVLRWAQPSSDAAEVLLLRLLPEGIAHRFRIDSRLDVLDEVHFESWATAEQGTQREYAGQLMAWVPIPPGVSDHAGFAFRNAWRCA